MSNAVDRAGATLGGKYLTFFLADEEYGVEILLVQEIISTMPVTRVPRTPTHFRGVINLRGKVIPVMDLRARFGMEPARVPEQVMIVVQLDRALIALVADRVSEVASISAGEIGPIPDFGVGSRTEFLDGLCTANGRVRLLLNIARVLSTDDLSVVAAMPAIAPDA